MNWKGFVYLNICCFSFCEIICTFIFIGIWDKKKFFLKDPPILFTHNIPINFQWGIHSNKNLYIGMKNRLKWNIKDKKKVLIEKTFWNELLKITCLNDINDREGYYCWNPWGKRLKKIHRNIFILLIVSFGCAYYGIFLYWYFLLSLLPNECF